MSRFPERRLHRAALTACLALGPLWQAQAQTTPPALPDSPPDAPCAHSQHPPHPPQPPHPPRLSAAQREQHLQKALALSADQAHQLETLLSQAREQHQPPDEARLSQLLSAEQRQRLRELRPPEPPAPPPVPMPDPGTRPDCRKPATAAPSGPSPRPAPRASSAPAAG